jgi:hypothetical protein
VSLTDVQRDAIRDMLLRSISDESENRWAAGWMGGIERELWAEGGQWREVAELVGWPGDYPGRDRDRDVWLTVAEADAKFGRPA